MIERITGDTNKEILRFENHKFDMVLADPLYDLELSEQVFLHEQFMRVCNGTVVVFSPPENQWIQPCDQYLFWVKPTSTKNVSRRYSRFVEMMFLYDAGYAKWNCKRHWSQYTNIFMDIVDDAKLHPFRKPPSMIERLILNHTDEGDWILDPFAGSHVVEMVGERLGRNVVSIEINDEYSTTTSR